MRQLPPLRRHALCVLAAAALTTAALPVALASAAPRAALAPGDHYETLVVGGLTRDFVLHVPPAVVAHRPLLLIYHGHTDTAETTEHMTDFSQVADKTGEVVAYLQGVNDAWNEQAGGGPNTGVNDVAYSSAVIASIESLIAFDHKRIVAVGFSNGAEMVEDLGCKLASTLAMIVPVEGEIAQTTAATCKPARPIGVYEVHGTADASISYNGGPINGHGVVVLSAPKSIARWAQLDHCAATTATTYPNATTKLTHFKRCRNKVAVTLRTIINGVHQWGSNIGQVVAANLPPA
jgi:polyhydroxybutyrate depolymerase